jgi:hypothetical protein
MALTTEELAYLRSELGTDIDQVDLQERHDRLGNVQAVAAEVVRERLATVINAPTSFTIPGAYSESRSDATVKALQDQAARLADALTGGSTTGRVVRRDRVR